MNNLTKSITIHSAYGVEVEYENGTVCRVDVNQPLYNYTEKTISVHVAIQDIENKEAKLLLNSLDKLTQEIDGKVGIVDMKKTFYNIDWRYVVINPFEVDISLDSNSGFSFGLTFEEIKGIQDYLLANHYNVFGLSSEYFKEKSL